MRMCDLGLSIEGSFVAEQIEQLHQELARRGIQFRPHYWIAEEWFSPDGIPGVAVPFYLLDPRLQKIEKQQMLEVEGGPKDECLRILRHEVGHAIDTAYRLSRRREWQRLFGRASQRYPEYYAPKPYSKRYVQHLDSWYAQSHPSEDFAETFAVWLRPGSRWRTQYSGWPALRKLEYVDSLMRDIADRKPVIRSRRIVESLSHVRKTLGEHYRQKREYYATEHPGIYDRDLRRLFSDAPKYRRRQAASAFLREVQTDLREHVANWTGQYRYTIDQVLQDMIARCRELKLRLRSSREHTKTNLMILLTAQTMQYLHGRFHRVAL
jgi:hypothetical protein